MFSNLSVIVVFLSMFVRSFDKSAATSCRHARQKFNAFQQKPAADSHNNHDQRWSCVVCTVSILMFARRRSGPYWFFCRSAVFLFFFLPVSPRCKILILMLANYTTFVLFFCFCIPEATCYQLCRLFISLLNVDEDDRFPF